MSTVACDQEVFKDGTSMGLFNMPKEEAENNSQTLRPS
jgi:hypothetical protein